MRGVRTRSGRGPLARWLVRRYRLALYYIAVMMLGRRAHHPRA